MSVLRSVSGVRAARPVDDASFPHGRRLPAGFITIASALAVFASFGTLVVQASDTAGVREFLRQSGGSSLSGLFRSAERPRYIAYAPHVVYQARPLPYFQNADLGRHRVAAPSAHHKARVKVAARKQEPLHGKGIAHATAYCVRLCDGYEFPLGPAADRTTQEETCQQSCPASPSALYIAPAGSDGVTGGRDRHGNLYTALPSAYAYRTSVSPTCGCSNVSGQGIARPPIQHDVTLKGGDLVMLERGLTVFSWGAGRARRFTSIHEAATLSESYRRKLKVLESGTIARAPTPSRQAKADLPNFEFEARSSASDRAHNRAETGQPIALVRIIPRTPPVLR